MQVGVIGSGTIGKGIAQLFAQYNFEVILCSSSKESAEKGKEKIKLELDNKVQRGKISEQQVSVILKNIVVGELEDCAPCEFIVEAIPEDLNKKKELFQKLDGICSRNCIFASNTSSLSISKMSEGLSRQVVGMHFFNPAPTMRLVEIIESESAKKEDVEKTFEIAMQLGKSPVIVKETPGFVVNRLLIPMINNAADIFDKGIASADDIDKAMKLGANHPMGPLQLADFIGIDVVYAILNTLKESLYDDSYTPCKIFEQMISRGELGKKTSKGFYNYGEEQK